MPAPIVVAIVGRTTTGEAGRPKIQYLLIRRVGEPYRGRWALVGGKWDFGETLAVAVIREVLEETGLEVEFVALRGIVSERLMPTETSETAAAHFLLLICQVDYKGGEASEQNEGAVAWFSADQIESLMREQTIIPSDYVMLQRFANAPALSHFEADMVSQPPSNGSDTDGASLQRFEEVA
jgi:8-oxo-dGTP diphosphatase